MSDERYLSGPDLAQDFPPIVDSLIPLPIAFDTKCTKCGDEMDRIDTVYRTRRRPFATLQCPNCPQRLYLFSAPRVPLILSHDDFPRSFGDSVRFSEWIDDVITKREHRREVELLRELGVRMPP